MHGAIPPHPITPSWRGAQLKRAQGKLYFYLYLFWSRRKIEIKWKFFYSWANNLDTLKRHIVFVGNSEGTYVHKVDC